MTRPIRAYPTNSSRFPGGRRAFLAQGVLGAAALGAGWLYLRRDQEIVTRNPTVFEFRPPEGITVTESLALSPDGNHIAFLGARTGEPPRVWIGSLETNTSRGLEGTYAAGGVPIWSYDSRHIAYSSGGKLYRVDITGAPPQPLGPVATNVVGGFWAQDNKITFSTIQDALQQIPASGGNPVPVTARREGEFMHVRPSLLPDGRHFVYLRAKLGVGGTDVYIGSLDAPPEADPGAPLLKNVSRVLYAPSTDPSEGYLLYTVGPLSPLASGTLMAHRFNPRSLSLVGEPEAIGDQVFAASISSSENGRLVYVKGAAGIPAVGVIPGLIEGQLTWFDRAGKPLRKVGKPGWYRSPVLSPQAQPTKVALEFVDPSIHNLDIQILDLANGVQRRFSHHATRDYTPVWSPDGSRVIYASETDDNALVWLEMASTGEGEEKVIFKPSKAGGPTAWAKNGLLIHSDLAGPSEIRVIDTTLPLEQRKSVAITNSESANDINGRLSPDEKFVVYSSTESSRNEIWVRSFNPSTFGNPAASKWMVSKNGGREGGAVWRRNEIFYISSDQKMMAVEVSTDPVFEEKGVAEELFNVPPGVLFFDVHPNGNEFLMPVPLAANSPRTSSFQVITDWTEKLRK